MLMIHEQWYCATSSKEGFGQGLGAVRALGRFMLRGEKKGKSEKKEEKKKKLVFMHQHV